MKNKSLILQIIILIIFLATSLLVIFRPWISYNLILKDNWNINIPKQDKVIYENDQRDMFEFGYKYTIIEYTDSKKIEKIKDADWAKGLIPNELKMKGILRKMNVQNKYFPNFNKDYGYMDKGIKNSEVFVIYIKSENKLYILESYKEKNK